MFRIVKFIYLYSIKAILEQWDSDIKDKLGVYFSHFRASMRW